MPAQDIHGIEPGSRPLHPVPVNHVFRTREELLTHARTLTGRTSGQLAQALGDIEFNRSADPKGKTGVGNLVERYFGKRADNESQPDFPEIGVELKTLPMKLRGEGWTVKESTSISMINYFRLVAEDWTTAPVRKKLQCILWVPYEHDYGDKRRAVFREPFLWTPPAGDWPVLERDYVRVKEVVAAGRAHELSEAMCDVLAPRRKGAKGQTAPQPFSTLMARSRAWALKAAYTRPIVARRVLARPMISLVHDVRRLSSLERFEGYVEQRLRRYENWSLSRIARATGAEVGRGKGSAAAFVRELLGVKIRGRIEEFEKLGIRIHTVWARRSTMRPWEAVSFPAMSLSEFTEEEWEDSQLRDDIDKILFIPLFSERRGTPSARSLGRAFFWSPSSQDWSIIEAEWRMYQELVRRGALDQLPGYSETQCIHMRPHARDASDQDTDIRGNRITRQSFWLNPGFLQRILLRSPNVSPSTGVEQD